MNLTDETIDHSLDMSRYCSDCGQRLVRGHHCAEEDARLDRMEAAMEYDARMRDETRQGRTVDVDEGWSEGTSSFVRQLDEDRMALRDE